MFHRDGKSLRRLLPISMSAIPRTFAYSEHYYGFGFITGIEALSFDVLVARGGRLTHSGQLLSIDFAAGVDGQFF